MVMQTIMKRSEKITHATGCEEAWVCICKNTPMDQGFFACDEKGDEMEPIEGEWKDLYACAKCGRIIDQMTSEVVGRNSKPKRLE
jgi:hypothetical protein